MTDPTSLFSRCVAVDPTDPAATESQLKAVPDKPAVYLLATQDDQPVLLASGQAVRSILRRKLGEPIREERGAISFPQGERGTVPSSRTAGKRGPSPAGTRAQSPRPDLRPIIRKVYLHPTFSPFETDLWYLWIAQKAQGWRSPGLGNGSAVETSVRRRCWMVYGDPNERAPRLTVTDSFAASGGRWIGPLPDRRSAGSLVDLLTDLFKLCHYYQVLRQAPHGRACEYREMGRCSGPCDGSVSLDEYRRQIAEALDFAADAGRAWRALQAAAMDRAARDLRFEQAQRIKDRLERAARQLDRPATRWLMDIARLDFLIVQPGARKAELRTFRSFAGRLAAGPMLVRKSPAEGLAAWLALPSPPPDAHARALEAGLLAHYLFREQDDRGLFVHYQGQPVEELASKVAAAFA